MNYLLDFIIITQIHSDDCLNVGKETSIKHLGKTHFTRSYF